MNNPSVPLNDTVQQEPLRPTLYKRLMNPLVIMLLLFGFPYIAAWYYLDNDDSFSSGTLGNHGELVSPMVSLGDYSLDTSAGNTITTQNMAGNWLLFTTSSSCEKSCQDTLLLIRQARKSTGINRKVIKPILLLQSETALTPFKVDLSEAFPQLSVVNATSQDASALISKFSQTYAEVENSIYMVDPYNNLMMYYPEGIEPKALMEDLKRLLKVNKPKI